MDYSPPGSSVHGILQVRILEWGCHALLYRGSSLSRDQTQTLMWLALADVFFTTSTTFSSVQSLSRVRLFVTPWTVARQASLSITNSQSLLKLMSIESVMPSNHLILCRPLLLLPSIFPSIRVFANRSVLLIKWPKYWSFSFNISSSNGSPKLRYN